MYWEPVVWSKRRVVTPTLNWFASPIRSPPTNRLVRNSSVRFGSGSAVSKIGSSSWLRYGT